jgi:hypothetical protein
MIDFEKCEIVPRNDMKGRKFNKLTVLYYVYSIRAISLTHYYRCLCECGNETTVTTQNLRSGNTKSCGCWRKEKFRLKQLREESSEIYEHH